MQDLKTIRDGIRDAVTLIAENTYDKGASDPRPELACTLSQQGLVRVLSRLGRLAAWVDDLIRTYEQVPALIEDHTRMRAILQRLVEARDGQISKEQPGSEGVVLTVSVEEAELVRTLLSTTAPGELRI